jgi:hypothetical protein
VLREKAKIGLAARRSPSVVYIGIWEVWVGPAQRVPFVSTDRRDQSCRCELQIRSLSFATLTLPVRMSGDERLSCITLDTCLLFARSFIKQWVVASPRGLRAGAARPE